MAPGVVIRPESDRDAGGIRHVLVAAFRGEAEAHLVETLRSNRALVISLVASSGHEIVGHVAFSQMHADGQPDRPDLLGLAPVAVHPQWQRQGAGSALIKAGVNECRRRAVTAVFVIGGPKFYARFGFIPARQHGLRCVYDAPPDAFQLLLLADALTTLPTGLVRYRPEFDSFA